MAEKTDKCLITVILPVQLIGSKGTKLPFMPYKQYCYKEKGFYDFECFKPECGPMGIYKHPGYIIEINEEYFAIQANNVIESDNELTEREQSGPGESYVDHIKFDHVKDYKKEALENLGIDVRSNEKTDYNGEWLEKLLK